MAVNWRMVAIAVAMVLLGPSRGQAQSIDFEKVAAEGIGDEYQAALDSALAQAIAQSKGVDVARTVVSQSVRGSSTQATATETAAIGNSATHTSEVTGAVVATEDGSADAIGAAEGIRGTEVAAVGAAAQVTHQDFAADRTVVSLASQTSGAINRYQVLSSEKREDGWHVGILAEIPVYKAPTENLRKKVAILPLRLERADAKFRDFENAFRTDLTQQLTQSSKLAMLDRDFSGEQQSELDFMKDRDVKKDEMARLGNRLGADYIVVGVVNDASVKSETVYMQSIGRAVSGAATISAKLTYRIIETATGRIDLADSWATEGRPVTKLQDTAQSAAEDVSRSIIEALFPMRVEHLSNGVFYLGQGGKTVKTGQQYRVVKLGADIIDSYTKEVIGQDETEIGKIEIFEVGTKLAKARLVGAPSAPVPTDAAGLVVRLVNGDALIGATGKPLAAKSAGKAEMVKASPTAAKGLLDKNKDNW